MQNWLPRGQPYKSPDWRLRTNCRRFGVHTQTAEYLFTQNRRKDLFLWEPLAR